MKKKNIVFLTGSGISASAGIPTFRDSGTGLWENYDILEVCTEGCFERDPEKAYGFYSYLHSKYFDVSPTDAHRMIAALEGRDGLTVTVITQNVDDLHEKAGSSKVLHLHGDFRKIRAVDDPRWVREWGPDVVMHEDTIIEGHYIRPDVVLFGEDVPAMGEATEIVRSSDILVVIGTSLVVYPAAGLLEEAPGKVVYIDPSPSVSIPGLKIIKSSADIGVEKWLKEEGLYE